MTPASESSKQPRAVFLQRAWQGLVGLEEAVEALGGRDVVAARVELIQVCHRLAGLAHEAGFERMASVMEHLGRLARCVAASPVAEASMSERDDLDSSHKEICELLEEARTVLPMVFENIAAEGREALPQLAAMLWRLESSLPAIEEAAEARAAAAAPGEVDIELRRIREDDREMMAIFGPEAVEHLTGIRRQLGRLMAAPETLTRQRMPDASLRELFRHVHTLKGAAFTVGCSSIGTLAHAMEDLLVGGFRDAGGRALVDRLSSPGADDLQVLRRATELLERMVETLGAERPDSGAFIALGWESKSLQSVYVQRLHEIAEHTRRRLDRAIDQESGDGEPPYGTLASDRRESAADAWTQPPDGENDLTFRSSLRLDVERLDLLFNQVGEAVLARHRVHHLIDCQRPQLISQAHAHSFDEQIHEQLGDQLQSLRGVLRQMRRDIARLRHLPIGHVFDRFAPLVRDTCRRLGVSAQLVTSGRDVEVDHQVADRLGELLTHLVQNAIHHGLESPAERLEAGKPETGVLELTACRCGRSILVEVVDDGRGIDVGALAARAEVWTEDADVELLDLIYVPGLSTAPSVTLGAGRGVGMDAVRHGVWALGGELRVTTLAGRGSRFVIEIPATHVVTEAVYARVGNHEVAVPLPSVRQLHHVIGSRLEVRKGVRLLDGDPPLRLLCLAELLGLRPAPPRTVPDLEGIAIEIAAAPSPTALLVDEVLRVEEIVSKSVGEFFSGVPWISAATVSPDERVVLVLDAAALVEAQECAP